MLLIMLSLGPLTLVMQRSLGAAGVYIYKLGPKRSHHVDASASCLQLKAVITVGTQRSHLVSSPHPLHDATRAQEPWSPLSLCPIQWSKQKTNC
jgi:hypothetical protein